MTTMSILLLAFIAIVGFAIINLFLWLLEFLAATIKCMVAYFLSKPHNWQQSYFDVRMLFTRLLLVFSFAMLSPRTMVKQQDLVKRYRRKENKKEEARAIKREDTRRHLRNLIKSKDKHSKREE